MISINGFYSKSMCSFLGCKDKDSRLSEMVYSALFYLFQHVVRQAKPFILFIHKIQSQTVHIIKLQ